jgi:hypothetical protein
MRLGNEPHTIMSIPLIRCNIYKAAKGDADAYDKLIKDITYNKWFGSYCEFGCRCEPPCEIPTQEQFDALNKHIDEHFAANPVKSRWAGLIKKD